MTTKPIHFLPTSRGSLLFAAAWLCVVAASSHAADERFAIRAGAFLNDKGALVKDVVLLVESGKITAIGPDVKVPRDCIVLDRSQAVLCPGFIDVHVTLGTMQNTSEAAHSIESQADAADLFNRFSHDFARAVRAGVTTVVLAPAGSHLVGGSTAVVKTAGDSTPRRMVRHGPAKLSLSAAAFTVQRTPTSLEGGLDELRHLVAEARENNHDDSPLARWARGRAAAIVEVDTAATLGSLARFAAAEKLKCVALHSNYAGERLKDVQSLNQPVILGPYDFQDSLRFTRVPRILHEAGVDFALTSDAPRHGPEMLRIAAAMAIAQGLPPKAAAASITTIPARIAGVADRLGSLAAGKDADFIVFSGDPLSLTSRIMEVFVDGQRVFRLTPAHHSDSERRAAWNMVAADTGRAGR